MHYSNNGIYVDGVWTSLDLSLWHIDLKVGKGRPIRPHK
jgi:hypothetical protein